MFPEAVQTRAEIKTLLNICHKIIRKTRDNNDTGHGHGSFLRSLCSEHNKKFDLTDREIVHSLCAFFFAGVFINVQHCDTSASLVVHVAATPSPKLAYDLKFVGEYNGTCSHAYFDYACIAPENSRKS
mmetsp:Transcript_7991/g.12855  ORF Transcript_7991/g.12855 Transcript_7991/m.12855 type:complete len:128 (-) Transcript_7991:912-1295(-)